MKKYIYDTWGNLLVWLPVGKPCVINEDKGSYKVLQTQITDLRSLKTVIGSPIYFKHPDNGIITPRNFDKHKQIGVALEDFRPTTDKGIEVKVKIMDQDMIRDIIARKIVEVSPCYTEVHGYREYNHLAILPYGYAKGGRQMDIKTESLSQIIMTPEEIKSIADQVAGHLVTSVEAIEENEANLQMARIEGYKEGVEEGKWLVIAKVEGYDGADVVAAKNHILSAKFPEIKIEGLDPKVLEGLLLAATSMKVESVTEPVREKLDDVKPPTVKVEGTNVAAAINRFATKIRKA